MSTLDWRHQPILLGEKGIAARKTAAGRFAGWHYELVKSPAHPGGPMRWRGLFHDQSPLALGRPAVQELGSGSYQQALRAVTRHHEHPGYW
jgi:hypothetical protein